MLSPPLCKGRLGGVEQPALYLPAPLLTKEGNRRRCRAPPYKGGMSGEMYVNTTGSERGAGRVGAAHEVGVEAAGGAAQGIELTDSPGGKLPLALLPTETRETAHE